MKTIAPQEQASDFRRALERQELYESNLDTLVANPQVSALSVSREHYLNLIRHIGELNNANIVLHDGHARLIRRIHKLRDVLTQVKHGAEYVDELGELIDAALVDTK